MVFRLESREGLGKVVYIERRYIQKEEIVYMGLGRLVTSVIRHRIDIVACSIIIGGY